MLVTLSAWNYSHVYAALAAFTVILTAGYILRAIQRVYLGAEYRGPHEEALTPLTRRELAIATPLVFLAVVFGVYPQSLFEYLTPSVNQQVETLATWTRDVHDAEAAVDAVQAARDAALEHVAANSGVSTP